MTSKFSENDEKSFMRLVNHKPLWKDRSLSKKSPDSISNGVCIEPFQTLSSYYLWMKRNLILNKVKDEYIYISGSNVILENLHTKKQTIIPISNDCDATSLFFQSTSSKDRIIIGEKVKTSPFRKKVSGRIEIINLDKKRIEEKTERIILNLDAYVDYDSFVYDCSAPDSGDYCLIVLNHTNRETNKSKIFIYSFTINQIIAIEDFKHKLYSLKNDYLENNKFLIFSDHYLAIWKFEMGRKVFEKDTEIYDHDFLEEKLNGYDITEACFIKYQTENQKFAMCIGLSEGYIEIFEAVGEKVNASKSILNANSFNEEDKKDEDQNLAKKHKIGNAILSSGFIESVPEEKDIKPKEEEEEKKEEEKKDDDKEESKKDEDITSKKTLKSDIKEEEVKYTYRKFLRINIYEFFFNQSWVVLRKSRQKPELWEKILKKEELGLSGQIRDNFIEFDLHAFTPNFSKEENDKENESGGKPSIKVGSFLKHFISRGKYLFTFIENSSIVIVFEFVQDEDNKTKIKVSCIEKLKYKLLVNSNVNIDSKASRIVITNGDNIENFLNRFKETNPEVNSEEFNLTALSINYYSYKINYVDGSPNFVYEGQILENTGLGFPVERLLVSEAPKMLVINTGSNNKDLYIYKQVQTSNEEQFRNNKISTEVGTNNFIHSHTKFYKDNTKFEFYLKHECNEDSTYKINFIAFSPFAKAFFVSFHECGFLYAILGKEIKPIFKVTMHCKACTFDETGTYFAFSTSELENDYTVYVYNLITYDYDYVFTQLPAPMKLVFADGNKMLLAQFNDSPNLLGWKLHWSKRLIEYKNKNIIAKEKTSDKVEDAEEEKNNKEMVLKVDLTGGTIKDFVYDPTLEHLLITSAEKLQKIYKGNGEEKNWEFKSEIVYLKCLLIKRYNCVVFGTETGTLRTCLWPICGLFASDHILHPDYNEVCIHAGPVTSMVLSSDNNLIYSSGEDGSVFISCITAISQDTPVNMNTFIYFDQNNFLPKKVYFDYKDVMYTTDQIYDQKSQELANKKSAIQSMISTHITEKEKTISDNATALEKERTKLTNKLQEQVDAIKAIEGQKENETKNSKNEREELIKRLKEELNKIKKNFKKEKEQKQAETTAYISCIKIAKEKFNQRKIEIENLRNQTNSKIVQGLEDMYHLLQNKKEEINKAISDREKKFSNDCEKNEESYETELREKEKLYKKFLEDFENKKKEYENQIMKKNKDNKNYNEKILEWNNHLKELNTNNQELMETYIFNTLKLNQMNQLLSENETKISLKEKIVKDKRLVNDRLEQLRFVLEYQIKNLILEKTPIEEQIKNFESLHSDFYKRFNLLYAELLNISDLIQNNEECIKSYRLELSETKKKLYILKNLYKSIDVALNSILKNKLDSKKLIIEQIYDVYKQYLYNFSDDKKQENVQSPEIKLQTKNIEKEIYHQKNNVLKELIEKRSERKRIIQEKEEMMKDIRLDNQLLIQECSNIRENLEDILKNINDIEKKFIELTNNNAFLSKDANIDNIKGKIKKAKETILIHDSDKVRVSKKVTKDKSILPTISNNNEIDINNVQILNADELLKKQKQNAEELKHQDEETEKMRQKLKELVGDDNINFNNNNNNLNDSNNINQSINNNSQRSEQMQNMDNSRKISIKSNKYIDASNEDAIK